LRAFDLQCRQCVLQSKLRDLHAARRALLSASVRLTATLASARDRFAPTKGDAEMIRKLATGGYRLYSRKKDPKTGRRRNLGTFNSREAAEKHERAVQYFKRH
jgi:hypothetical protein